MEGVWAGRSGVSARTAARGDQGPTPISRVEDGGAQGAFRGFPAAEDRAAVAIAVTVGFVVGGSQAHDAVHVEGVQDDAGAVRMRPRFHQTGEAQREDLNLAADRALLAPELGLKLARSGEALLELAGGKGPAWSCDASLSVRASTAHSRCS